MKQARISQRPHQQHGVRSDAAIQQKNQRKAEQRKQHADGLHGPGLICQQPLVRLFRPEQAQKNQEKKAKKRKNR